MSVTTRMEQPPARPTVVYAPSAGKYALIIGETCHLLVEQDLEHLIQEAIDARDVKDRARAMSRPPIEQA